MVEITEMICVDLARLAMSRSKLLRRQFVFIFKRAIEMGGIFETAFVADFTDVQGGSQQKHFGVFQPFFRKPFGRRIIEMRFEISFKRREASAAQFGEVFHFQVVLKVF